MKSARDQTSERENRARERDRNREVIPINVIPQVDAENRAGRLKARNSMDGRDQNASRGVGDSNPGKRTCPTYGPDSVETWAESEIEQETFAFLWSLKKYSAFSGAEKVMSPIFRGGPNSNHSWQLKICPKQKSGELEYFAAYVNLIAFGDGGGTCLNRKIKARFQISILDEDGRPGKQAGSAIMNIHEFKLLHGWGYNIILSNDLISPSRRLLVDDTLKIHCRVWIDCDTKHKVCIGGAAKKSLPDEEKLKRRTERLVNDFGKLFKYTVMADIAVTTDNSTFMAHKAVLAVRSSVFAAMFNTNMVEKESNTVEIPDFEDVIVKAMLEYMYTGKTELLNERAPDLLEVAEKYDLAGLKEDCEYTIADNLNVENAAQALVMAHMYNASLLKPRVMDYINRNKEAVGKTESFAQITQAHPNVIAALYLSQLRNVS